MVTPAAQRKAVVHLRDAFGMSERQASKTIGRRDRRQAKLGRELPRGAEHGRVQHPTTHHRTPHRPKTARQGPRHD